MIDELLLSKEDFKPYRDISENVDLDRLDPWILEAQKQEMRAFLGPELYLAMIKDYPAGGPFPAGRFLVLWEGVDVDEKYRFYGLKPAIIYFAYARFLKNQKTVVTRFGVRNFDNDTSEQQADAATRTRQGEAQSMAVSMQADTEQFLNDNPTDYPEFNRANGAQNQKNIYHNVRRVRRF